MESGYVHKQLPGGACRPGSLKVPGIWLVAQNQVVGRIPGGEVASCLSLDNQFAVQVQPRTSIQAAGQQQVIKFPAEKAPAGDWLAAFSSPGVVRRLA
jgi:hypothetical protein